MRNMMRTMLLVTIALAIPVVPLLLLGFTFEERVTKWLNVERSPAVHFLLIVGLLATDIFLPIPSSAVSTYAGGSGLGFLLATSASWLGMTLGAVFGFGFARLLGHPFAARFAGQQNLERMAIPAQRFGPLAILLTRALPIFAEACVLLMGATQLSWKRFLPPILVSNFVISLTYAAFGVYFVGSDALPAAIVVSAIVPFILALIARRWLPIFRLPTSEIREPEITKPADEQSPSNIA